MNIATLLFCFESELADYLDADVADEPNRQAVVDLLGHVHAVRMLPGLDCPPDDELAKSQSAAIHKTFGPPSEDCEAAPEWDELH